MKKAGEYAQWFRAHADARTRQRWNETHVVIPLACAGRFVLLALVSTLFAWSHSAFPLLALPVIAHAVARGTTGREIPIRPARSVLGGVCAGLVFHLKFPVLVLLGGGATHAAQAWPRSRAFDPALFERYVAAVKLEENPYPLIGEALGARYAYVERTRSFYAYLRGRSSQFRAVYQDTFAVVFEVRRAVNSCALRLPEHGRTASTSTYVHAEVRAKRNRRHRHAFRHTQGNVPPRGRDARDFGGRSLHS
jgi:hypothetical protein